MLRLCWKTMVPKRITSWCSTMDKLSRMTDGQFRRVKKLIQDLCANCDGGNCLLLDNGFDSCVCPQILTHAVVCKYFRIAVLPADLELYAELGGDCRGAKRCRICGRIFIAGSNRAMYCPGCGHQEQRRKTRLRVRRHRGQM